MVAPTIGGCQVFPADNVWNTAVDRLPVHASSATWVSTILSSRSNLHPDFGSFYLGAPIGIPFITVPGTQPRVAVTFGEPDAAPTERLNRILWQDARGWGTPYPVVMGVIAGLLDLIPMIGATIAGTILVLATLTQGLTPALIMLAIVLVYQQFENYVLQPTILGKAADVSGFFVIVSVMIFGALFGVIGAIIAVPIIASIQIVVKELTTERRARMAALREAPDSAPVGTPAVAPETL